MIVQDFGWTKLTFIRGKKSLKILRTEILAVRSALLLCSIFCRFRFYLNPQINVWPLSSQNVLSRYFQPCSSISLYFTQNYARYRYLFRLPALDGSLCGKANSKVKYHFYF